MWLLRKLVSIPSILLCVIIAGYLGLRIFLSSHYVTEAVRTRLAHDLNCDVNLSRASLSPMGTLILENLSLTYRKADGLHQVFTADLVEVEFEPMSLLETRLRFMGLKFSGAALALERDSEGWLTLGRIVRPIGNRPALSLVVEASDSVLRVGEATVPVDFFRAEVSRTGDRVDVFVKEGALLGGGVEAGGYVMMQEDPSIHGEFKFRGISLSRLFRENKEPVFDVQGEASCEIVVNGRASSPNLLTTGSHLAVKDFSLALSERGSGKEPGPIVAVSRLDLRSTSSPMEGRAMILDMAAERPEISVPGLLACRNHVGLIPASQRVAALMSRIDKIEVNITGSGLKIQHPRASAATEKFDGRLTKSGESVSLQGFKARLWGGDIEGDASFYRSDTNWFVKGHVDLKDVGLQNAAPLSVGEEDVFAPTAGRTAGFKASRPAGLGDKNTPAASAAATASPPKTVKLGGWLTAGFDFQARSQAEPVFTGDGNVSVRRAQLWDLPVFACVATLLKLPEGATSIPQEFRGAFSADSDKMTFLRIELVNDHVKVFGKGVARYSGDVDLDLGLNVTLPKSDSSRGLLKIFEPSQRYRVSVNGDFVSSEAAMGEKKQ